jgi:hypothetical protein
MPHDKIEIEADRLARLADEIVARQEVREATGTLTPSQILDAHETALAAVQDPRLAAGLAGCAPVARKVELGEFERRLALETTPAQARAVCREALREAEKIGRGKGKPAGDGVVVPLRPGGRIPEVGEPEWVMSLNKETGELYIRACQENVRRGLYLHPAWAGKIRLNERTLDIEMADTPIGTGLYRDTDAVEIKAWLDAHVGDIGPMSTIDAVTRAAGQAQAYDPVRDYLMGLPQWDRQPRASDFFYRYFGSPDTEYSRWLSWAFLSACVARGLNPGCIYRLVPIIRGEQNTGKSMAIRNLAGEYYDSIAGNVHDKDALMAASRAWIVEMEEMAAARQSDVEHLKRFISCTVDRYRPPYGRSIVVRPRGCVFVATTNRGECLSDETGATRFYPISSGAVDYEAIARDRGQLFAEIRDSGLNDQWWAPPQEAFDELDIERDGAQAKDSWEDLIRDWLDSPEVRVRGPLKVHEILAGCIGMDPDKMDRRAETRIGNAVKRVDGWERKRFSRKDGSRYWAYSRE